VGILVERTYIAAGVPLGLFARPRRHTEVTHRKGPVVEARVTDEKLVELLAYQTEYDTLDYKRKLDLGTPKGKVETAKDVGAMKVLGGFIVVGVDDHGKPTGELTPDEAKLLDEATLAAIMRKFLPEPLDLLARVIEVDGQDVGLIYVGAHPDGCAVFKADGQYPEPGQKKPTLVFRTGDVFWRNGTSSERMSQSGLRAIIERGVLARREEWMADQDERRRADLAEVRASFEAREVARGPTAEYGLGLDAGTLADATLELARAGDDIPLQQLLKAATRRSRELLLENPTHFEDEFGIVLDKLASVGAALLDYERDEWFDRVVKTLARIYDIALDERGLRLSYEGNIDPAAVAPRFWLEIIRRVYGLGALAVRLDNWSAVKKLTLTRPARLDDYEKTWLRHALTMAARSRQLREERNGDTVEVGLLALALRDVVRLERLRPDIGDDYEAALTSLAQFDVLYCITSIGAARSVEGAAFYTNFAPYRSDRVEPVVVQLLKDADMRATLFPLADEDLAVALSEINRRAQHEGFRMAGFWGFDTSAVENFIRDNFPQSVEAA
jgi:hypothetical protein